jgi:hypothetical protein
MLKFLCLSVLVAAAHAIVCPPNACQMVRCAAVTAESCGGTIKTNGGFCGCCDACITELGMYNNFFPDYNCRSFYY